MQETADTAQLREYALRNSEEAFAALVSRYVDMVYSAALRKTGNPHAAEEVTQVVFIILAKKADRLTDEKILSGWLYQTTRFVAAGFLRRETRRIHREQEAYMQSLSEEPDTNVWQEIQPLLDDAMGRLGEKERNAVVLRFFEGRSFQEIGMTVGATENAAKKRVSHALDKLRKYFARRGVVFTAAVIASALAGNSVQAAPVALAKTATAAAIVHGVSSGGSTLTLIEGALKLMALAKAKTAIIIGLGVVLATGITTVTVKEIKKSNSNAWQEHGFNSQEELDRMPAQVRILPARDPSAVGRLGIGREKMFGLGQPAEIIVQASYGAVNNPRIVLDANLATDLPGGTYDFIATLPKGNKEALQQEVGRKFGVVSKREIQEAEVLLLRVRSPNASGLRPTTGRERSRVANSGQLSYVNSPISDLIADLESFLGTPVLDRSGLAGNFDLDFKWDANLTKQRERHEQLKQSVLDQLGLELTPSRESIEMVVVAKAR